MELVSIGLPVYNGDRYLAAAIESILDQTYSDLELVICDNASEDQTEQICRDFATRDSRVRYHRNPENVGASPNYNLTFSHSSGTLFKWAAHDDLLAPTFVAECVDALNDSDAVLVFPKIKVIDEDGEMLHYKERGPDTSDPRPAYRFRELLREHVITEVFGLIRRDQLASTRLIGPFPSADRVLLAELALRGRFVYLPHPLFLHRDHEDRSHKRLTTAHERAAWFATRSPTRYPAWRFLRECLDVVRKAPIPLAEKKDCVIALSRWARNNQRRLRTDVSRLVSGSP